MPLTNYGPVIVAFLDQAWKIYGKDGFRSDPDQVARWIRQQVAEVQRGPDARRDDAR